MSQQPPLQNSEERLRVENEILKMKLMLENGASFHSESDEPLDPQLENNFLNYIMEFEKQSQESSIITLFEKIGKPSHFPAPDLVKDNEIEKVWKELDEHLKKHGISLDVCSPNVNSRELYRFAVEELFKVEVSKMNIPGMMMGFIYDEFHPDPVYETTRAATMHCINYILEKKPLEWMHHFCRENLRINRHENLSAASFVMLINRFKSSYDELAISHIEHTDCVIKHPEGMVSGNYSVLANRRGESLLLTGNWKVWFKYDEKIDYWDISAIDMEGIEF